MDVDEDVLVASAPMRVEFRSSVLLVDDEVEVEVPLRLMYTVAVVVDSLHQGDAVAAVDTVGKLNPPSVEAGLSDDGLGVS